MVHKKYIKQGNKVFGPYLYETKRVNGKVVTKYIGKAKESRRNKRKISNFLPYLLIFILLISLFLFLSYLSEFPKEVKIKNKVTLINLFIFIVRNNSSYCEYLRIPRIFNSLGLNSRYIQE